jgi:AhpC/TSA family
MTDSLDCKWIENNLEALFCDRLEPEQDRLARAHIENCASCRLEMQALNAIDPVVKKHFQRELRIAQQPRVAHTGRLFGLSAAALALAAILVFAGLRTLQTTPPPAPSQPAATLLPPVAEIPAPPPVKNPDPNVPPVERAKPVTAAANAPDQLSRALPSKSDNAPDFLVKDLAGYSRRIEDFRGHVVVITVWSGASPEAISNFEKLYKAHGAQAKFRFVGVSNERLTKPANATFPVFYNQGSTLFGVRSGEVVVLDEKGVVTLRGSLTKDFDRISHGLNGFSG